MFITTCIEIWKSLHPAFMGVLSCVLCFLLNPEKKFGADPSFRFREKRKKTHTLIPKNDVTEPKARLQLLTG